MASIRPRTPDSVRQTACSIGRTIRPMVHRYTPKPIRLTTTALQRSCPSLVQYNNTAIATAQQRQKQTSKINRAMPWTIALALPRTRLIVGLERRGRQMIDRHRSSQGGIESVSLPMKHRIKSYATASVTPHKSDQRSIMASAFCDTSTISETAYRTGRASDPTARYPDSKCCLCGRRPSPCPP